LNQFSTDGGTTWNSAFIVQNIPAWHLISGTQYISSDPSLPQLPSGDTWYRVTFTLPSSFSNPSLNIRIHADNAATIYLNPTNALPSPNNQIGAQPQQRILSNFQDLPETFTTSSPSLFKPGTNTLYFRISNFDFQTAFDYLANVGYCLPRIGTQPPDDVVGPPGGGPPPSEIACAPGSTERFIDLRSGNGPVGSTDPLNQFSTNGGTTWNSAFIVSKEVLWANRIGNSQWISSDPGRQVPQSGDVWYRVTFTLPAGFSIPSLQGQIHADNAATIYLNSPPPSPSPNNQIGAQPQQPILSNFQGSPEFFGTTANFVTGTNTLYFRVSNFGGPTGLDYHATVRYCQAVVDLPVERTCAEGIPTIVGTPGPDNLPGTAGPDFIAGRGGSDIINGLGGDDIICGDAGNDPQLNGGAGNDRIIGGAGNDGLNGGAGNDGMWGEAGLDGMAGGAGNDGLNGGTDADGLNGDAGDDVIDGRDTPMSGDILNGGTHITGDYCISGPGDTRVSCELG
jgi:hypothetical protein